MNCFFSCGCCCSKEEKLNYLNNLPSEIEYLICDYSNYYSYFNNSKNTKIETLTNLPVCLKKIYFIGNNEIYKEINENWKIPFGCEIIRVNKNRINNIYYWRLIEYDEELYTKCEIKTFCQNLYNLKFNYIECNETKKKYINIVYGLYTLRNILFI